VRIFLEFDMELPDLTIRLIGLGDWLADDGWIVYLAFFAFGLLVVLLILSSTLRWYCPVVGRFYRRSIQSRVLHLLAAVLEAGKTVPQAFELLAKTEYFSGVVRDRLEHVGLRVEQGEPLADSMRRGQLLSPAMVPLVRAAETVRNLPWVLRELGDTLNNNLIRRIRRISVTLAPLILIVIGGLVGFMVVGMFLPLIEMITSLSQ